MTNISYTKSAIAMAALSMLPPLIRETLIQDVDFQKEYGFTTDAVIEFGDPEFCFQRSELYNAVRKLFSGISVKGVLDKNGQTWKLININGESELPSLELSNGEQRLILPNLAGLSPDSITRLRYLNEIASDVNLPTRTREAWSEILSGRALKDDEVDALSSEFLDTPISQSRSIRREIVARNSSLFSLVPSSRRYYERLVGAFDGSTSIRDYAAGKGRTFFEQLCAWRPYDGFLLSLLLSSHSALTDVININQLSCEDLIHIFDFLDKHGDRISQLGAIELGLRIIPESPQLEPFLIRLVEQIRDDDIDGQNSGYKLLSALFILVDGELSRIKIFSDEPPFYRRLAAMSQAALIQREFLKSGVDIDVDSFCEWAFSNCGQQYYLQSLVDMRIEPRWNPDLVEPSQIKAYFFGRIITEAMKYQQNIKEFKLYEIILGTNSRSLQSLSKFSAYFPGPLEGAEDSKNILPIELSEAIEKQLCTQKVGPSSFIALVNSSQIFQIDTDQASLAAKALKLSSYRLANVEERFQLLATLNGLATVAAIARSCSLADELRILVRRYKRDANYALSIEEIVRICLVAASSRVSLTDWRDFVGDWLTELAFGDLEGDAGMVLHSYIVCLSKVIPELWVSCGRADAALVAYNARNC